MNFTTDSEINSHVRLRLQNILLFFFLIYRWVCAESDDHQYHSKIKNFCEHLTFVFLILFLFVQHRVLYCLSNCAHKHNKIGHFISTNNHHYPLHSMHKSICLKFWNKTKPFLNIRFSTNNFLLINTNCFMAYINI